MSMNVSITINDCPLSLSFDREKTSTAFIKNLDGACKRIISFISKHYDGANVVKLSVDDTNVAEYISKTIKMKFNDIVVDLV